MVIGIYIEHSLQRPSCNAVCLIQSSRWIARKLDDQQNGAHRAPKGIAPLILANILIGLECFYPEPCRDAKANRDRHRSCHD